MVGGRYIVPWLMVGFWDELGDTRYCLLRVMRMNDHIHIYYLPI